MQSQVSYSFPIQTAFTFNTSNPHFYLRLCNAISGEKNKECKGVIETMGKNRRIYNKGKRWTKEDKEVFERAYKEFGNRWEVIQRALPTKNLAQIRRYAVKTVLKHERAKRNSNSLTFTFLNKLGETIKS